MKHTRKAPKEGDTRIVQRFALLPIFTIDQVAWLCWVSILQEYSTDYTYGGWRNVTFM